MTDFKFENKVALVTGANRGIGEAYVIALIEAGVKQVYAAARNLSNLDSLLKRYPDQVVPVLLDVTNSTHISALADIIESLDILINNAGVANAAGFVSEDSMDIARQEMEVNYFAPLSITRVLLPKLKQSDQAVVINISSIAGIANLPSIAPYSATKAAVHSFTQGLRSNLSADGIQVMGVYPGPIDTRMAEGFEMEKPIPQQVAQRTFDALENEKTDVFPDDFSEHMYGLFLDHPHQLEKAFAEMAG